MAKPKSGFENVKKSGKVTGLQVTTKDGDTTRYYFTKSGNVNYYQRGIDGTPGPTPLNMSPSEFKKRVEANGATTKNISASERSKEEIIKKQKRKAADKFLDEQWYKAAPRPRKGMKGH